MTLNLFGQNLSLILCSLVTLQLVLLASFLIKSTVEIKPSEPKHNKKLQAQLRLKHQQLIILLSTPLVSLGLAFILRALIGHYTESDIPVGITFMILPTTVGIGVFILVWMNKPNIRFRIMSSSCFIISVLFSLALINSYYRYYPTLGTVFNRNQAITLDHNLEKQVLVSYLPDKDASQLDNSSVEYNLTSISKQPTSGKVFSLNIPGTTSKFHARNAYVYIPAIYNNPSTAHLPVILLTEGVPGAPTDWVNSGLQATMDTFAQHHSGITPLVFIVDDTGSITNDTECVDSPRGNVETYLTVDVPNYIKSNFNVESDPSHWAIGGLSMGGTCSIMLALRHPNVYHYFLDFGGEMAPEIGNTSKTINTIFNGSESEWQQHQPDYLLRTRSYKNMGGFFAVGSSDARAVTDAAKTLSTDSQRAGIETIYESYNGHHSFDIWQGSFKQSLPWLSSRIGATECQTTCI